MKRQLIWFLSLTFVLSWGICFALTARWSYGDPQVMFGLIAVMFMPALCSLLTRLITREGFGHMELRMRFFRGGWIDYAIAWLGIPLLIIVGGAFYFLLFSGQFDPSMGLYRQMAGAAAEGMTDGQLMADAFIGLGIGMVISPIANALPCLGEELGWRGYLLPKLCELIGEGPAVIATGLIWGVWHAPIIAMGHNYGKDYAGYPVAGIGAMVLFCVLMGAVLGRLSLRAESCWPAVIGHAALNGMAQAAVLFLSADASPTPFIGPMPMGIVGGAGIAAAGLYCLVRAFWRPVYQTRNDIFSG